jgi:hypothetical protein
MSPQVPGRFRVKTVIYCNQATHDVSPDQATAHPLVNANLIGNSAVARSLHTVYDENRVG